MLCLRTISGAAYPGLLLLLMLSGRVLRGAGLLRGLAEGGAYSCSLQELENRVTEKLLSQPECADQYKTTIGSAGFRSMGTEQQLQALDAFCSSRCAASFNEAVGSWRTWCRSSSFFEPAPGLDGFAYSRWFGCGHSSKSGELCARAYSRHDSWASAEACDFWTSCCAGDYFSVVRSALTPERADAGCPGTTAAARTSC